MCLPTASDHKTTNSLLEDRQHCLISAVNARRSLTVIEDFRHDLTFAVNSPVVLKILLSLEESSVVLEFDDQIFHFCTKILL